MRVNLFNRIVAKIQNIIIKPGDLFRYGTPSWRKNYFLISNFLRKSVVNERKSFPATDSIIDDVKGFYFENIASLDKAFDINLTKAIDYSNEKIDKYIQLNKLNNNSKDYLQSVLHKSELKPSDPIIKIAMDDYLVNLASNYLGMIPIIGQIQLWHSPNNSIQEEGSQFFHLDYADIKQFKVFIMLDDIDKNTGPLTFLPSRESKIISEAINYKLSNEDIRISDEVVKKYVSKDSWVQATGKKGQILYIDTCRCMHFGSRNGVKPRRILMIQYITPFSFTLPWKFKGNTYLNSLFKDNSNLEEISVNKRLLIGL
jgi:hypothetical protein